MEGKQMCKLCDDGGEHGHEPAEAQSRAEGANLTDVLCAFRDIAYAMQALNNALSPHGHETEINTLLVSAHDAIDRAAHNAEVRGGDNDERKTMDAYDEMLASQRGDEPALAPSALTDGLAAALYQLVSDWEREAAFLSNPNDHPQDKAVGKTYAECASKLRAAIGG